MKRAILFTVLLFVVGCGDQAPMSNYKIDSEVNHVIYGENNISLPNDSQKLQSDATVALVTKEDALKMKNGLSDRRVGEMYSVDEDLGFSLSDSYSYCSGVLVGRGQVLTAGHCFEERVCENTVVVFNYKNEVGKHLREFRECKSVIKKIDLIKGLDYAVIELNKSIRVNTPKISTKEVVVGQKLYALGSPLGVSQRSSAGWIRSIDNKLNIVTNLDVFEGNSGSPVFSQDSGELVGILSGGENDFTTDADGNEIMVRCSDTGCGGEIVIPIKKIIEDMVNQQ